MKFLDTNILVRYLLQDVEKQLIFIHNLFDQAILNGEELLILNEVLIELNYVLAHHYGIEKDKILEKIADILDLGFIKVVSNSDLDFYKVLNLYSQNKFSLEDAMYLQYCLQNNLELITFDQKLKSVWNQK
jgi:predicted nucleic-acid-binding protein